MPALSLIVIVAEQPTVLSQLRFCSCHVISCKLILGGAGVSPIFSNAQCGKVYLLYIRHCILSTSHSSLRSKLKRGLKGVGGSP